MNISIGEKIRCLRVQKDLTQEELADRCELSKGFISQIERDLTSPSIATLMDILECLGSNLTDFFSVKDQEKLVFHKEDFFTKEDREAGQVIRWIVPNAQKNDMEPILLTLEPQSRSMEDEPHIGQEFGYVLTGSVTVVLGETRVKAKKGESFYYTCNKNHYLENTGHGPATVLWVCTPPNF